MENTGGYEKNLAMLRELCGEELYFDEYSCRSTRICFASAEGMVDGIQYGDTVSGIIAACERIFDCSPESVSETVRVHLLTVPGAMSFTDPNAVLEKIYSGHLAVFVEGVPEIRTAQVNGYKTRSVEKPTNEVNILGGKEAFIESARVNQTMLRRRMKTPDLRFETMKVGNISKTNCILCWLDGAADPKLIAHAKRCLRSKKVDVVADTGAVRLLLNRRTWSVFPEIGHSERPDTVCAMLYNGRAVVIIDGTPFALIIPYLFTDAFSSIDDYITKTGFANLIRLFKYVAFFFAAFLPPLYVAIVSVHPEFMPQPLLLTIMVAQQSVPFPLVIEMLLLLVIYEIMREAGLRLPREVGHAVSLVGALVIGETAAAAGIIGTPTILVAAISIISTFVVPVLSESVVVIRFALVILGGTLGLLGIALGYAVVCSMLCRNTGYSVPFSSGISPTDMKTFFGTFFKHKRQAVASPDMPKINQMPGSGGEQT